MFVTWFCECLDDYVYEVIPIDDSKTNNQSSYQDSLLSGNNDGTIPLSQGHALSNCKIANMSKKNQYHLPVMAQCSGQPNHHFEQQQ
jgi:hypothetical protein